MVIEDLKGAAAKRHAAINRQAEAGRRLSRVHPTDRPIGKTQAFFEFGERKYTWDQVQALSNRLPVRVLQRFIAQHAAQGRQN